MYIEGALKKKGGGGTQRNQTKCPSRVPWRHHGDSPFGGEMGKRLDWREMVKA